MTDLYDADALRDEGYTERQVEWLLARSNRRGFTGAVLTWDELERLLPDLPREEVDP